MDWMIEPLCGIGLALIAGKLGEPAYVPLTTGRCFGYPGFGERQRSHQRAHGRTIVRYWICVVVAACANAVLGYHHT